MTDQLQTAKDWLGDLSKIVSRQKTKEDYEYAKKRTDSLGWLINRVDDLEEWREQYHERNMVLLRENQRYKQALKDTVKFNNIHIAQNALKEEPQ